MFHGWKDDENLHKQAGRYGEALGEMYAVPGADKHHEALDAGSENLRAATLAVPKAQAEYEAAVEAEKQSKATLRDIVHGAIALSRFIDPKLAAQMPNLGKYEDSDIYFASDRAAAILAADPRTAAMGQGIAKAKDERDRAQKDKSDKLELRDRSYAQYRVARARAQKAIKEAFIFITENAPKGSRATQLVKRKSPTRKAENSAAEPAKGDATTPDASAPVAGPA